MSVFDLAKSEIWINDVAKELGTDEERAYLALRAGLHALRDRLTVDEVAHLAAQMPMMIRGLFYEGWHPGGRRPKLRSRGSFLDRIDREMLNGPLDAAQVARAVFKVLDHHVSRGQLENVRHTLPAPVAELWQERVALP